MYIGERLHAIRKAKKVSLTELSEKSRVQMATLSRIENKKMVGTLESHIQIAKALGIDVTELYKGITQENAIIDFGPEKNMDVFTHSDEASFEILTKNIMNKKMMPTLVRIEEGGKTNKEQASGGTEKFIFVLDGHVEINVNNQIFNLHKYNTLYFDASLPHYLRNTGKGTAKLICVGTPVSL
ncbi:MAG: helix-turn-helix transcriptional regulator [Candidatus Omnitrophica bacterium]|nr:helix-turn-helix transcriptional regulator [Candidatus Omnitrophota bacterium]MDE2010435.1 helix-turn-helix transcriptional regulator [Candidatus Omnitrophota bacterium]MDE2215352.1 helix-turn-helix transcriptional regulator [Candidatus Omnitrophota bacterium]MDE2232307.1 helix-turn-helix transcriptional regulator [Candidatus Omnitrophota bacterium]